jgi:hypothetical protein
MLNIPTDTIGIAGDWHGNTGWAKDCINAFQEVGVKHIFHLGDFGIWGGHDGASYIRKVNKWLLQNDQTLYITPGNHEDYVRINASPVGSDGTLWYQGLERLKVLPRGFRGLLGHTVSKSWVSLGGANSIDFKGRTEGISWWREESITASDVYNTIQGGYADFMFCHDAPTGIPMEYESKSETAGWHPDEVRYSNAGREMLKHAVDMVRPSVLFHGHHHVYQDLVTTMKVYGDEAYYDMRSLGLSCDNMKNNIIAFDVADGTYVILK